MAEIGANPQGLREHGIKYYAIHDLFFFRTTVFPPCDYAVTWCARNVIVIVRVDWEGSLYIHSGTGTICSIVPPIAVPLKEWNCLPQYRIMWVLYLSLYHGPPSVWATIGER